MKPRVRSFGWRLVLAFALYLVIANGLLVLFLALMGWPLAADEASREALAKKLLAPEFLAAGLILQGIAGMMVAILMARVVDRRPLGDLGVGGRAGFRWGDAGWGLILGIILAATVTLFIAAISGRHLRGAHFGGESAAVLILVPVSILVAAFAEEWFFRGYLYANLRDRFPPMRAIPLAAIAFSLLHVANPGGNTLAWVNIILVGIVLAELREMTGGILMPFGLHLGWNLTLGMGFGVPVSGYSFPSVLRVSLEDLPLALGGGAFGVEASGVLTALFGGTALVLGQRIARPPGRTTPTI